MEEHLIGVKINDQKAHLQKVLEEVRIANAELTKTFAQIEATKEEQRLALRALDSVHQDIADAGEQKALIERDCMRIVSEAEKTWSKAEQHYLNSLADETLSQIRVELNEEKIKSLSAQIDELGGFIVTSNDQAAQITNDIGSLEQQKLDLEAQVKELRKRIDTERETGWVELAEKDKQLKGLQTQVTQAEITLSAKRQETASLFAHLDEREKKLEIAEQDNQILRSRLYELLKEQQQKL